MNDKVLYIVGNGFDLHHGIKSSYAAFGLYLKHFYPELYSTFEKYFPFYGDWSKFEEILGHFDADFLLEDNLMSLVPYSSEEWRDSHNHDYQYEIETVVTALSKTLKQRFTLWATTLDIPDSRSFTGPLLNLDKAARYLTFNYTDTLQRLYGVPPQNVLHIHNRAINESSDLVLGHARNPKDMDSRSSIEDVADQDTRITQANAIIDRYFSVTYKPTKEIIKAHSAFFESLTMVEQINIIGHSLSVVDLPYLVETAKWIEKNSVRWVIGYYEDTKIPEFKEVMQTLEIPDSLTSYIPTSAF